MRDFGLKNRYLVLYMCAYAHVLRSPAIPTLAYVFRSALN